MASDAAAQVDPYVVNNETVLVVWIGANDMSLTPGTVAATLATLQTYCADRIAAGAKIVLVTQGPQGYGGAPEQFAAYEAVRHDWNDGLRAAVGQGWAHKIADVAADPVIGADGVNLTAPENWSDTTHYNDTGYLLAGAIIADAVRSLL